MSQSSINNYAQGLARRPSRFNIVQRVRDAVTGIADSLGVPLDAFAARSGELDDDVGVLRYQTSTVYEYYTRDDDGDTKIGSVQFRITLYTLSDPEDEVKQYLKDTTKGRLKHLFNSGTYNDYMEGFQFIAKNTSTESAQLVGRDEIPPTGLGVPNYSVEVYDYEGNLVGHSTGYSMDFGITENQVTTDDAPEGEVWRVRSYNESRGDYELGPEPGPARERAKRMGGKTIYINGMPTGSVTQRGTSWMSREHKSPSRATYRSRQQITDTTATPYQALSPGSKLYKVRETSDGVYFSTVEPRDFAEIDPDDVDPDATGLIDSEKVMALDDDEPTQFVIVEDVADEWAMGKFSNGTVEEIAHEATYTIYNS